MSNRWVLGLVVFALGVLGRSPVRHEVSVETGAPRAVRLRLVELPLRFERNDGQFGPLVKYVARSGRASLFLTDEGATLALRAAHEVARDRKRTRGQDVQAAPAEHATVLEMKVVGGRRVAPAGTEELVTRSNYFLGNDPTKWRTNVPNYARVTYESVKDGVDLVFRGDGGKLEYDFVVAPATSVDDVALEVAGAEGLSTDDHGNLVIDTGRGKLLQPPPRVYQRAVDGSEQLIEGRYRVTGQRVAFSVGRYDRERPLVIDPVLEYSTFLGGASDDEASGIAVDASGNAYVTGYADSTNFPTQSPLQGSCSTPFCWDAFVAKLNPQGSALVYSTYLGGNGDDRALGIAVDAGGNAYVTGHTDSPNFPTQNPLQGSYAEYIDAFVAKLDPQGSALVYSTYLGGSDYDGGSGIAVDASGNAYVTGGTASANFPTESPLQGSFGQNIDAFVAKINPPGSALVYSTYLGGNGNDQGFGIAVDVGGSAYVTGGTASTNFPVQSPLQGSNAGGSDAFVAKLNPQGSALVYSTYLGGNGDGPVLDERGDGIAVDASGNAYITGCTNSTNLPTQSPLQSSNAGNNDAFIAKLNPQGSALVYSTYLGGSDYDEGSDIAVDASGNAYVTGSTASTDFPTQSPLQGSSGGNSEVFVTKIDPQGSALVYSTYLGAHGFDGGFAVAVDGSGKAYVAGSTSSTYFPTHNPLQGSYAGGWDAFITKIDEACSTSADCNDGNACTADACNAGACSNTPISGCNPDAGAAGAAGAGGTAGSATGGSGGSGGATGGTSGALGGTGNEDAGATGGSRGSSSGDSGGCGCHAAGSSPATLPAFVLVGLGAAWARRRRRVTSRDSLGAHHRAAPGCR